MFEITKLAQSNITQLAMKIQSEGILRGFDIKDFEIELKNQNALLLQCDESAFCLFHFAEIDADLIEIWCAPNRRKQGLSYALLSNGIMQLNQLGILNLFLEVAIDNDAAISLYEKLGFEKIGVRKQYYARENGLYIDAISMKLEIEKFAAFTNAKKCT